MVLEDDTYVIEGPVSPQPILDISLGELIYNNLILNQYKTTPAMIDAVTERQISYNEILALTSTLAKKLTEKGYGKNTIIALSSENSLEFFIPVIAALYIGALVAPINHAYTPQELIHTLTISKPTVVFCSKAVVDKFVQLKKKELRCIERIIVIDGGVQKFRGAETLKEFLEGEIVYEVDLAKIEPSEHVAFISCSSGTTGLPKGVMMTHRNIMVRYMHSLDNSNTAIAESFLGILPFFHAYGLITNLNAIVQGQTVVVLPRFEEKSFLNAISKYKITRLWLAPPLLVFLAKSPLVLKYDLSHVEEITSGAAPLSKETEELVKKRLKAADIRQGYGLSEATLAITLVPLNNMKEKTGSSGTAVPYMRLKVRDPETGKSLGPYQTGEMCVKGPMVMKGYFGNPEATRNSFTSDGWLLTGDMVYYDEDKYFYVVDRLKELIKYNGFQVAPAELEAVLLKHPEIRDCGVVGLPREDVGELPLAFVVKAPNSKLCGKDVEEYVAKHVSAQKRIRGGVIFIEAIPKNPSGKILRRELRVMLNKHKSKL